MQHGESLRFRFHSRGITRDAQHTAIAVNHHALISAKKNTIKNTTLPKWHGTPPIPILSKIERYDLASFPRGWLPFYLYTRVDCYEKT